MDYEKKYEEALELARDYYKANQKLGESEENEVLSDIFPELAESEDEKIKRCVKYAIDKLFLKEKIVCDVHKDDVLAWLEKQESVEEIVERCKTSWYNEGKIQGQIEGLSDEEKYQQGWHDALEKQGDKPFDYENANIQQKDFAPKSQRMVSAEATEATYTTEVETGDGSIKALVTGKVVMPKFKVGDWIANDYCMGKVIALTDDAYLLDTGQGIPFSCEHNAHLWTIQDAKDGDVLVASDKSLFIYDGSINENGSVGFHIAFTEDMDIILNSDDGCGWKEKDSCHLATKKQRDLLFSKMKEEGYEWDDEKLEPIKVPKTKEHEGTLKQLLDEQEKLYEAAKIVSEDKDTALAFLKSAGIIDENGELSEKYRCEQTLATTVTAWSEEDERTLQGIWDEILANKHDAKEYEWKTYDKFLDWLKSLKDRVQPKQEWSEEDEKIAKTIINEFEQCSEWYCANGLTKEDCIAWLNRQMHTKWSEEDKKKVNSLYVLLDQMVSFNMLSNKDATEFKDWLESLSPQSHWKPSDEQMRALHDMNLTGNISYAGQGQTLIELYNDLKKLKG